jgi:hypothetical protein
MTSTTNSTVLEENMDTEARNRMRQLNQWRDRIEARFQARRRIGTIARTQRSGRPAEIVLGEG